MENLGNKINDYADDVIKDNNFLFESFQGRLSLRIMHIFEKYKIPVNQKIILKNIEENFVNSLYDLNSEIIYKYLNMLKTYEKIIVDYVEKKENVDVIKKSTMSFINRISKKNADLVPQNLVNNLLESMNNMVYVYDNYNLNIEVAKRIKTDCYEILDEFCKNNYNFVIETINKIIKNIISNL